MWKLWKCKFLTQNHLCTKRSLKAKKGHLLRPFDKPWLTSYEHFFLLEYTLFNGTLNRGLKGL
jgi:hypothetical protein